MKILNWFLVAVFALFAIVQYNDPDPLLWMLLYGGVAALYAAAALGYRQARWFRPTAWVLLAAAVLWAASLAPGFIHWFQSGAPSIVGSMKAETPYVELTREFLGLMLAAVAVGSSLRSE